MTGDKTDVTALVKYAQSLEAENARLRAALEDARHYAAVCPPPPELTGEARIEMLARRHRIGMAGVHEQREPTKTCQYEYCVTPEGCLSDGCKHPRSERCGS